MTAFGRCGVAGLFAALAMLGGAAPALGHGDGTPVLIDTDMGLDDVRALFALLAAENLDIHGIISAEGSASLGKGTDNLLGLVEAVNRAPTPVLQGAPAPGLEPPRWRSMADGLGGLRFPPPRAAAGRAAFDQAVEMLASHYQSIHYLALGPLTNLARIERAYPGALKRLHTLWIPVRLDESGHARAWNLSWNAAATAEALPQARRVVLIDLNSAGQLDAKDLLSSAAGPAPAGRWIQDMLAGPGGQAPHLAIYDELAAAVLIDQSLVEVAAETRAFDAIEDGAVRLRRDDTGNVHIASFAGGAKAAALLKKCWSKVPPAPSRGDVGPAGLSAREFLKAFHGHLGPYVVLGYRMGRLALERTGAAGHFDLSAEVHSQLEPPPSCLIDGIQIGSGCTLGKRNIQVFACDGPAHATFRADSGAAVTIRLKADVPGLVAALIAEQGVEPAGDILLEKDWRSLFEVQPD